MKNHRPSRATAATTLTVSVIVATCSWLGRAVDNGPENAMMKPSVTYLHLLRHTPMFTQLDTSQLRWTIEHSREWEARPGTVVADCTTDGTGRDDDIWILLDGRWQVEENGRSHPARHADPGKWFSGTATRGDCRLVTTEKSYVMKVTRTDMDDMLARGFGYGPHLREGEAYYASIFNHASEQRTVQHPLASNSCAAKVAIKVQPLQSDQREYKTQLETASQPALQEPSWGKR